MKYPITINFFDIKPFFLFDTNFINLPHLQLFLIFLNILKTK